MPPGKQRYKRTRMVLPCRVWLDDGSDHSGPTQLAHTLDVTQAGAMVGGLHTQFEPGAVVVLQRGQFKARFRVVWTKQLGRGEVRAGIEAIDPDRNIWGVDLPPESVNPCDQAEPAHEQVNATPVQAITPASTRVAMQHRRSAQAFGQPLMPNPKRSRNWMAVFGSVAAMLAVACGVLLVQHMQRTPVNDGSYVSEMPSPVTVPAVPTDVAEERSAPATLISTRRVSARTPQPLRLQISDPPKGFPVYPVSPDPSLRGKVALQLVITKNGVVKQVHVLSGNRVLASAAAETVRMWRYKSYELNGEPVEAESNIIISFLGPDAVSVSYPSVNNTLAVYQPARFTQISTQ